MRQCSPYIFCALHKNICTLTSGLQGRQVISPCMCHLVHPLTHPSDTFCSNAFISRHPHPRHVVGIRSEIPPPISKGRPWQRTRAAGQLQDRAISAVLGPRWRRAGQDWGGLIGDVYEEMTEVGEWKPHPRVWLGRGGMWGGQSHCETWSWCWDIHFFKASSYIFYLCFLYYFPQRSRIHPTFESWHPLWEELQKETESDAHGEKLYSSQTLGFDLSVGFQDGEIQLKRQWHF